MPSMNGFYRFAVAKAIRELCPDTAILVYSMYSPEAFLKEAKRLGIDQYVSKSEPRQALLNAVARVERRLNGMGSNQTEEGVP
jgi:DNA-binding NarL/FixJ family response regulator